MQERPRSGRSLAGRPRTRPSASADRSRAMSRQRLLHRLGTCYRQDAAALAIVTERTRDRRLADRPYCSGIAHRKGGGRPLPPAPRNRSRPARCRRDARSQPATRILRLYTNTAMSEVVAVADQHDDSDDGVILATNACRWRILAA